MKKDEMNRPWSDVYEEAGYDWADKEAAAQLLEECRSAVFSQWCTEQGDIPVNRSEQIVKSQARWREYNNDMVNARHLANKAKVRLESVKMRAMEEQARQANYRMEARLT